MFTLAHHHHHIDARQLQFVGWWVVGNPTFEEFGSGGVAGDDVGGIFTARDIEAGEIILQIPQRMLFTGDPVMTEPMIRRLKKVVRDLLCPPSPWHLA